MAREIGQHSAFSSYQPSSIRSHRDWVESQKVNGKLWREVTLSDLFALEFQKWKDRALNKITRFVVRMLNRCCRSDFHI